MSADITKWSLNDRSPLVENHSTGSKLPWPNPVHLSSLADKIWGVFWCLALILIHPSGVLPFPLLWALQRKPLIRLTYFTLEIRVVLIQALPSLFSATCISPKDHQLVFTGQSLPLGLPSVLSAKSTKFCIGDDAGRVQDTLLKIWCFGILNILS